MDILAPDRSDPQTDYELAAVQYRAALELFGQGRIGFDHVVRACEALAIASRNRRLLGRKQAA